MSDKSEIEAIEARMALRLESLANAILEEEKRKLFLQEMFGFKELFGSFLRKRKDVINWEKIKPPPEEMVLPYEDLPKCTVEEATILANKLCVLKLNGGLGTTMGCTGPKSVIEVHSDMTFLDLTVKQIEDLNETYSAQVPLILMNSFNTHEDTVKVVNKYSQSRATVFNFNQSKYPRIYKDSLSPVPPDNDKEGWYPPGHGDVFRSFANSGLLDSMIKEGKEYVFISNVDNLGATVDFHILSYLLKSGCEYAMEVTDKTRSDVKGGTLIDYDSHAKLLEIAQCPPSKVDEFKSIKKFKIFNTNNLWVSLKAIERVVNEGSLRDLDIIFNPKKLSDGSSVIQLETAAGAAIQFFQKAKGINVPRSRFLPVKSTSDLFVVQSNLYTMEKGQLIINPKRIFPTVPLVKLGDSFSKVSDYMNRFKGTPDILELDQLTVSGDVTFGSGIVLKGTVIIVANHGNRIDIPSGAVLENKVVSGNLRILEH
jgi:UTP--glucose-1-phosphate uridylyltransferase